jgi:hypothetical protein
VRRRKLPPSVVTTSTLTTDDESRMNLWANSEEMIRAPRALEGETIIVNRVEPCRFAIAVYKQVK